MVNRQHRVYRRPLGERVEGYALVNLLLHPGVGDLGRHLPASFAKELPNFQDIKVGIDHFAPRILSAFGASAGPGFGSQIGRSGFSGLGFVDGPGFVVGRGGAVVGAACARKIPRFDNLIIFCSSTCDRCAATALTP